MLLALACPAAFALETVPFDHPRWQLAGERAEVVRVDGRDALLLHDGRAALTDADFESGVIEFALRVTPQRGFHGVHFRVHDDGNSENFYIRPHQSGNDDANQYTPVFNGLPGWQLYYGPPFSAPTVYRFDDWIPVRIVVSGAAADIYVYDMETPALQVALKNRQVSGPIVLWSGFAPAYYADFRYRAGTADLRGAPERAPRPPDGIVAQWEVSTPFSESRLEGVSQLLGAHTEGLEWQSVAAEDRGYANLARAARRGDDSDTVFARLRVASPEAATRMLEFGFSDRARVYLNGRLVYTGDNGYQTRDYRYLGTIGLFDALALDLQAGDNEVLVAVSESFGGWGVMARISSAE